MKDHWASPIENNVLCWAVELEESNGDTCIILKVGNNSWFESRKEAHRHAVVLRTRDYVKRATAIRVRVIKEG